MKSFFFNLLLAVAFVVMCTNFLHAQSAAENLEKAVEEYNGLRTYMDGFDAKTVNNDHLATMKTRMDKGILLLEKVINEGNAEQVKAARYFKSNFKYEYGFVLGMKGENYKAFDIMKEIEKDFTTFSSNDFPLRYTFFGKNFVVNWDNFAPTQAEYYTGMAEISYNVSKYEDAVRFNRLALSHPNNTDWLRYVALNKMIDIYSKKNSVLTETEYLDFALECMKSYDKLEESSKKTVKEYNYPTVNRSAEILINKAKQDHSAPILLRCAAAAPIAAKYEIGQANALKLLELCYRNDHPEITEFHWVAVNLAQIMSSTDRDRANYVGISALDRIVEKLGANDCEAMPKIVEGYRSFGNATKANALDERHRKCVAEQVVQRQREEEQRQKQAEADRKRQHRYEHPFNMYIGFNLIPVLTKPEKMDFGGHVDLRGRRVAHSFGYAIVQAKKDLYSESEEWDGYRAFYALKIFGKSLSNQTAYTGLYFGYSEKEFMPLLGQINSKIDPLDYRQETLIPKDKQYDLVWNSGFQALGKGIGIDMWYGFGASYYQISYGEINLDEYGITGHEFFEKRSKKDGVSIFMRFGISIGLNVGRERS